MAGTKRQKVFISYSHRDEAWMERLRVHLEPLERIGVLDFWFDEDIEPGDDWFASIEQALEETRVAVLLISPDFLASEFIATHELPPILRAAERGTLRVLPLYIASSNVGMMRELSVFQGINNPGNPVASLPPAEQDKALVEASKAIIDALGMAPWKQRRYLIQRVLPLALLFIGVVTVALLILRPVLQERSTHAVVIIPGLDIRSVLPEPGGVVANPRTFTIRFPGSEVSVDTMFQRIYVVGGDSGVLERIYVKNDELWRGVVRTFLVNSEVVQEDRLDYAVDRMTSLETSFIDSPRLRAGDRVDVVVIEDNGSGMRTELNKTITIQESPVTTYVLMLDD